MKQVTQIVRILQQGMTSPILCKTIDGGLQQYVSVVTENDLDKERDMVLKFISKAGQDCVV